MITLGTVSSNKFKNIKCCYPHITVLELHMMTLLSKQCSSNKYFLTFNLRSNCNMLIYVNFGAKQFQSKYGSSGKKGNLENSWYKNIERSRSFVCIIYHEVKVGNYTFHIEWRLWSHHSVGWAPTYHMPKQSRAPSFLSVKLFMVLNDSNLTWLIIKILLTNVVIISTITDK